MGKMEKDIDKRSQDNRHLQICMVRHTQQTYAKMHGETHITDICKNAWQGIHDRHLQKCMARHTMGTR